MKISKNTPPKVLSVFSLVMINVIAVDNLRSLPISAEYGFSLVFFYLLAALVFFIPVALVAAELATGWPESGGLYIWVREAFGKRWGLTVMWLQWIYNVVWYPTILSFIAATFAYLFHPQLAQDKIYMLSMVLGLFWIITFVNCFGMKASSLISTFAALIGTIVPMVMIIILGLVWIIKGQPIQLHFTTKTFFPNLSDINNLGFLTAVLFGLIGVELSAVHAGEVKNPKRDYPRALLISSLIIFSTLIFAALAIAIVIPHNKISLVTGLIQAFGIFFNAYHMHWMIPVIAIFIIIGGLGGVSTWIIGPSKGLMVAAKDGCLPEIFSKTNRNGAPVKILITQAIIFSILCTVFLLMPSINSSYWLLSALTAQLALLVYILMFAAVIQLRYKKGHIERKFKIPFGKPGVWVVGGMGLVSCIAVLLLGFQPPKQINIGSLGFFEGFLILGIVIFTVMPLILYKKGVK